MSTDKDEVVESPDPHFEPTVTLPAVETKTLEEDEIEVFKIRAKLFRFDSAADPPEWKERGTGELKFLQHKTKGNFRMLMRRDKTHKVCANHYLTKDIKLLPSAGSDRAWVYTVQGDFADEEPKVEQLAIRFKNAENALKFKEELERCQSLHPDKNDNLTEEMEKLSVGEEKEEEEDKGGEGGMEGTSNVNETQQNKSPEEEKTTTKTVKDQGDGTAVGEDGKLVETN